MFEIELSDLKHNFIEKYNLKNIPELKLVKITPKEPLKIGDVEIQPRSQILPKICIEKVEQLQNFNIREGDVFVNTFAKCGTTWMQELCWLVLNNFDFNAAKQTELEKRSPYLECNTLVPTELIDTLDLLEKLKSPRVIKSHLSLHLLPKKLWTTNAKIIHVVRDPRDAALSLYHMQKGFGWNLESLEEFLKLYIGGLSDIFCLQSGLYWSHTLDLWKLRQNPNYLFVTFEEMKSNLASVIEKVCSFLNKSITEEQMARMLEHLSFESMKNNAMVNHITAQNQSLKLMDNKSNNYRFIRKGLVGSHKHEFPPEFSEIFNEWCRENLKNSDFPFYLKS